MASLLLRATKYAAFMHTNQRRKNKAATPYINHCIGVAYNLAEIGGVTDETILAAAMLHDTVEDTAATMKDLEEMFGAEVAGLVAEVTDDKSLPKATRKQLQIDNVAKKSNGAKMIKLADKLYNLQDLAAELPIGWTEERRVEYFKWANAVVSQISGVNAPLEKAVAVEIEAFLASNIV